MLYISDSIYEFINNITDKNGKLLSSKIHVYMNSILEHFLYENSLSVKELNYIVQHNLTDIPECPICGKRVKNFIRNIKYCSNKCAQLDKKTLHKKEQTCLKKYGTKYASQSRKVKDKIKQTCFEKYGFKTFGGSEQHKILMKTIFKNKVLSGEYDSVISQGLKTKRKLFFDIYQTRLNDKHIELISSKDDFIEGRFPLEYKCTKCNNIFKINAINPQHVYCQYCNNSTSKSEYEIFEYIQSIYTGIIEQNNRTILNGKELDIYIPGKQLAIEFNGDYWHSELYVDKYYHLSKTKECLKQNIRLIHIFEHEWDTKSDIVKSILKNALELVDIKIYARKCICSEIDSKTYTNFLDLNHIQGSINSKYKYGLYYNNELVSVIGFGSSRFKKGELELHRFCSKLNYSVIGAFTKLIHYFVLRTNSSEFYTYVDRAHFNGNGYYKAGFEFVSYTEPSYFYFKKKKIIS